MNRLERQNPRLEVRFKRQCALEIYNSSESGQVKSADNSSNNYEALFGKSLDHETNGLVKESELINLKTAISSGKQSDFDAITLGGSRKLANPQASMGFDVMGPDIDNFTMPVPPQLSSAEAASEMTEVYEMALLRNTTFDDIENEVGADVSRAITSLNNFGGDYKGVKIGGVVNGKSLFRANVDGFSIGPYVSQFLYKPVNFGPHTIEQKYGVEEGEYGITFSNWLEIQKGNIPVAQQSKSTAKYINNSRVLGSVVHDDFVYQLFLYAGLILQSAGANKNAGFASTPKEGAFVTNGGAVDWSSSLARLSRNALTSSWNQKWRNHLRLRPETMAGRVVSDEDNSTTYVHTDIFTNGANTLAAIKSANLSNGGENKSFLPLLYAEGSPTHPSYPAGHAVIAGALSTYLKCFFDCDQDISVLGSVVHSTDGDNLTNYAGDTTNMTVGTELNKLASNVARGRDIAGVHYLSDGYEGMLLGEKIALSFFKENINQYHETTGTFTVRKFDGNQITITKTI